jgi:hypothetical protein
VADDYSDAAELAWKLVSFLALPADRQAALVGSADPWFVEEVPEINAGANHLFGIAVSTGTYGPHLWDSAGLGPDSRLFELTALLDKMTSSPALSVWRTSALAEHPSWDLARRAATAVLQEAGLDVNPPEQPLSIPALIEVETYPFRRLGEDPESEPATLPRKR